MKPLLKSRKALIALLTLLLNALVVALTEHYGRPDLRDLGLQCVTLVGGLLLAAFGLADHGKEAAQIDSDSLKDDDA